MKKVIILLQLSFASITLFAQYVGINTTTPSARLHIRNPSIDSNALLINHNSGLITRIDGNRELLHEGNLWVHSAYGRMRLGYENNGWYWNTIGGGENLQLWSYNNPEVNGIKRLFANGTTGNFYMNTSLASEFLDHAQLRVDRGTGSATTTTEHGAILGITHNVSGSGLYGIAPGPRSGTNYYAGVTGFNSGVVGDRFGVIGITNGSIVGGVPSAGVGGYGVIGVLGSSGSATGAGVYAQSNSGNTALEVNNGFLKVSGTNKTAFSITATAGNSSGHILRLNYANPTSSDIVIVTHLYGPPGVGPFAYHNYNVGVFWNNTTWCIYNENTGIPILDRSFNVLVIKQ